MTKLRYIFCPFCNNPVNVNVWDIHLKLHLDPNYNYLMTPLIRQAKEVKLI